jgi:PAS domain S-box-containing protein
LFQELHMILTSNNAKIISKRLLSYILTSGNILILLTLLQVILYYKLDIAKLNDLALKINNTITSIEIHWKNMQALKPNDPKALKIFSGFLIEVLNDKEKGNELLSLWRETADKKQTYVGYLEIELDYQLLNYVKEGHALILCSAEPDTFGNIIKFSHVTSKIFGYTTSEIYGKNIEYLFLECYYSKLCYYFQQILSKAQSDSKSELFFGRSKYHYAIPLNISIREYKGTRSDQKCFILVIKNITNMIDLRNNIRTGYFIVDSRLKIVNYSSLTYEFITQFFVKMSSDSYYYLYEFFPEIYTQNHMEIKLYSSSINKRGTIFSPCAQLLEECKQNDFINIMENKDIRNDFIRINVKNTLFFKNNKSLTIIVNKNPEIKTICEKDSYKVELSLNPLVGLNFIDGSNNKNQNNTEILKQSMTTEQGILEEDDDSKMYAVTMKIHLYDEKIDVVLPINYVDKEIFPRLDEISSKINASNYKSFLELLKSGKHNIFSFYAVSKEGQKLTEMVEKFNFGGLALLNKTKEDENCIVN